MKAKTIAKTIQAKVADWLLSIDDKELAKRAERDIIVTGGCIASMFLQEPVNDYDVYFKNNETVLQLATHYVKKMIASGSYNVMPMIRITFKDQEEHENHIFRVTESNELNSFEMMPIWTQKELDNIERVEIFVKSQGFAAAGEQERTYEYFENSPQDRTSAFLEESAEEASIANAVPVSGEKYRPVFMSSNAITLSDSFQIVLRFSGDPAVIHESYDFVHATNYWTKDDGLVTNAEALESLLARELVYRGSLYPLASIFRTRKFIQRDWTCHIGNYLKMALQLGEFDLNDPATLEEQLTGVDAAYLHEIIKAVKQKKKESPDFQFTATYICQLVERMMG